MIHKVSFIYDLSLLQLVNSSSDLLQLQPPKKLSPDETAVDLTFSYSRLVDLVHPLTQVMRSSHSSNENAVQHTGQGSHVDSGFKYYSELFTFSRGRLVLTLGAAGNFLMIYICNFHVLSHLLLIYICKLHWNLNTMFVCQVTFF